MPPKFHAHKYWVCDHSSKQRHGPLYNKREAKKYRSKINTVNAFNFTIEESPLKYDVYMFQIMRVKP